MSYVDDNLLQGERILRRTHRHWVTFLTWRGLLTLFLGPWIDRKTSDFAVTDHRVMIKVGLIQRQTLDLNLTKVESVDVEQGVWGRMLGFGTLVVVGTGGSREAFPYIADPMGFRHAVQQASANLHGPARGSPLAAPPQEDTVARLEKAKTLFDKGLITADEYEAAKARVLGSL